MQENIQPGLKMGNDSNLYVRGFFFSNAHVQSLIFRRQDEVFLNIF